MTVARAIERLMALDAVLSERDTTWFATEQDKVAYFVHLHAVTTGELPALIFEQRGERTVRYFPEKLPIGLVPARGEVLLLYVATDRAGPGLQSFLTRHRPLLRRLARRQLNLPHRQK